MGCRTPSASCRESCPVCFERCERPGLLRSRASDDALEYAKVVTAQQFDLEKGTLSLPYRGGSSKDDQDRLYEVVSNDELRMLDGDGKAIESGLDYSLRRVMPATVLCTSKRRTPL